MLQAYPVTPSPEIYEAEIFGVGQGTDSSRSLNSKSVALPLQLSPSGLDYGQLRQEPAITSLDWLFTPSPRLEEHLLVEPLQASTQFYPRFTLPWARSTGFGSHPCDSRHFHTSSLIACGLFGFPSNPLLRLFLPHRCTPWRVILNAR